MHRREKTISVSALRHHFSEVERLLKQGASIRITKYGRAVARMLPLPSMESTRRPDFLNRLRAAFGDKVLKVSGVELLAQGRERF
jgi:antitoxin (DNA-binding transcriptional repressor) of toxin-antitoxin stability system